MNGMSGSTIWLALGGLHLLNGTAPPAADDPVILVPLPDREQGQDPDNTVILRWDALGPVDLIAGTPSVPQQHTTRAPATELFRDLVAAPALRAAAAAVSADRGGPLVPLFVVVRTESGAQSRTESRTESRAQSGAHPRAEADAQAGDLARGPGDAVHVHSQIRFLQEDACFIRLTDQPIPTADPLSLDWLAEAVRRHGQESLFLNNHQRYYRKCFKERELEYKYTLTAPVDSWTHTADLYRELRAGALPGYVMEYRDEFQAWDYLNHLFEITGPEPEVGYVSFIPTTDGRHLVKRKWYAQDTFDRRETHTYGVEVTDDGGFEEWITRELQVTAVRLPSFRRVRYDVNFESLRTGHVYGIFFDHCSLTDDSSVTLNQCELEYLRSRTVLEPDEDAVITEITAVAAWLERFLRERGLSDQPGYYSKRTFLKDAVAARPDLALEASPR